ncbi:PQQ-dependent sugar dehydrogenase [Larkinella soli]|uniref:PQQ-dependent sugar dehydrogenase n=1 Tax=Larkinella soli TaxID=1770527 RepID=UPI001E4DC31E|nr:PQQ-dependent sugar dehydrogenase [Larkinella soli]
MPKPLTSGKPLAAGFRLSLILAAIWGLSSMKYVRPPAEKPEENRFTKVVLAEKLDEPMALLPLDDGRVLFIERKGTIQRYDPATGETKVIATIPVSTKYTNKEGKTREAEDGLLGIVQDPKFAENHWIYLYYSAEGKEPKNVVARYELRGDELVMASRKVILEIPTQREECCHTGGGMVFDDRGNLHLLTGDNSSPFVPFVSGFAPIDERPGREAWDAQKSSSNTNDLRGKLLRIHPEADGTYTIPDGNLFPKGTPKTRPEIYVMGLRNPWRLSRDSRTGYLYWGEVGPDMRDSVGLGPDGYDEFNQAREPGNFGWPYVVGNNAAYWDYSYQTGKPTGRRFDPEKPVNDSPNNTGLTELPPSRKAFIWYSYGPTKEYPLMGSGGRSAVGGPIFHQADFKKADRLFPDYYEGKWFITEFMRGWIMVVTMDEQSNFVSMERFLPTERFDSPIDMKFSANGDLYLLEYGSAWFRGNDNAKLVRIEYNGGNRKPLVQLKADKTAGAVPFRVTFSSAGSTDLDQDNLSYEWKISPKAGGTARTFTTANPTVPFDKPGLYTATLTVTDAKGARNSKSLEIKAGNEPPVVDFAVTKGNKTFFFPGQTFNYAVSVNDREDGSLAAGKIAPAQVAVTIDYLPETFDLTNLASGQRGADASARFATAQKLIHESDCKSCHTVDQKSAGPAYKQIAQKYRGDRTAADRLARKVISGGSGVWGDIAMSAHPQLSLENAGEMVAYILSFAEDKPTAKSLPVKGSFTTNVPEGQSDRGYYILRAAYADKGTRLIPTLTGEKVLVLRSPVLAPEKADMQKGTEFTTAQGKSFYAVGSDSYIGYRSVDLTGLGRVGFFAQAPARMKAAGGTVEVHLDSPTGPLVGTTPELKRAAPPQPGGGNRGVPGRRTPNLIADLRPTTGIHDVYFVFKNANAEATQVLMQLTAVQFMELETSSTSGK